jgi:hypothetical protein
VICCSVESRLLIWLSYSSRRLSMFAEKNFMLTLL